MSSVEAPALSPDELREPLDPRSSVKPRSPLDPRPLRCCGRPLLRKDWDTVVTKSDRLGERVTTEEALWVVIFTMGIATDRDKILADLDLERWVLDFFMIWGPVAASVMYSSRFNDVDAFHYTLWAFFLGGMAGQIACLNHSLRGTAAFTGVLYGLIGLAFARVACLLPRARPFCVFFGASCGTAAVLSVAIACVEHAWSVRVRGLMWLNLLWEPMTHIIFFLVTENRPERKRAWDLPVAIEYIIKRYEGFHMMIMVCSFLFPIALQGALFASDARARVVVILANIYAVALKLGLLDTDEIAIELHAIRRSRPTAICFLCVHSFGMLGIGITGVGFVAAIKGVQADFTSNALCLGPAITWFIVGVTKLLHMPRSDAQAHSLKAAALCLASLIFLAPRAFRLDVFVTPWFVTVNMVGTLFTQLFIEYVHGSSLERWRFHAPRLLIDWENVGRRVGAQVSSMEHFFTVLVAVAVFALNENLGEIHDVRLYVLNFFVLYGALVHTMRYAMRFADDDGAHKLLWGVFQFGLLLVLEGLTSSAGAPYSLFKVSTLFMYLLVSLGFSGRIIVQLPRARYTASYFALASLTSAGLLASTLPRQGNGSAQMYAIAAIAMVGDPLLSLLQHMCTNSEEARRRIAMPVNPEYLVSRFENLQLEVLTVAIIVPNTIYPPHREHASFVVCGVFLTCVLAIVLKASLFDVAPVELDRHAVSLSERTRHIFFFAQPLIALGMALTGGAMAMLLKDVGDTGANAVSEFAQRLMPQAAALTLAALALDKWTHASIRHSVHMAKVVIGFIGAIVLALWPVYGRLATAFETMAFVVGMTSFVVAAQLTLNVCVNCLAPIDLHASGYAERPIVSSHPQSML